MNFIIWLVVGGLIGWVASLVMKTDAQQGLFLNVIVGIVGAVLGGWFISPLIGAGTINPTPNTGRLAVTLKPRGERDPAGRVVDRLQAKLAGIPGMSLPVGLAQEDGLPVGLQVLAPAMADDRLYRVGAALERALTARWGGNLLAQIPPLPELGRTTAELTGGVGR